MAENSMISLKTYYDNNDKTQNVKTQKKFQEKGFKILTQKEDLPEFVNQNNAGTKSAKNTVNKILTSNTTNLGKIIGDEDFSSKNMKNENSSYNSYNYDRNRRNNSRKITNRDNKDFNSNNNAKALPGSYNYGGKKINIDDEIQFPT